LELAGRQDRGQVRLELGLALEPEVFELVFQLDSYFSLFYYKLY
jgi:hypothetical protein